MVTASSLPVPVGGLTRPAATGNRLLRADLGRLDEVSASLAATAAEYDRTGSFPHAPLQLVHEAGLSTAGADTKYGGSGVSSTDVTKILLALGRGDPSTALIAGMTIVPHLLQTRSPWPEELYARVLEESALRPTLLNHARAEPEMGSSTRGGLPATTARRRRTGPRCPSPGRSATARAGVAGVSGCEPSSSASRAGPPSGSRSSWPAGGARSSPADRARGTTTPSTTAISG
ncbi:acyl-CoA dehydrogenase family protein [Streptomyces sp. NBC_01317]|uniref:acyl-CoA dehydrogenase family protein n=1 Tax=Streptomyces sp. NBC_01317 TaxID=2903822 RepID=UPI002E150C61|nr:acyl-CoA dehydrogenase family protein [Streptomyces sp. NBC_01317]